MAIIQGLAKLGGGGKGSTGLHMRPKQFTDRQYTKLRLFCKVSHNHKIQKVWTEMIKVVDDEQRWEILTSAIKIAAQQHTV